MLLNTIRKVYGWTERRKEGNKKVLQFSHKNMSLDGDVLNNNRNKDAKQATAEERLLFTKLALAKARQTLTGP